MTAWTIVAPADPADFRIPGDTPEKKLPDVIDRLWSARPEWYSAPDVGVMGRLATVSGIPLTRAMTIFFRLREAGIIFPDGTIGNSAMSLLRGEVRDHILGMRRREQPGRMAAGGGQR